MAGALLQIMHAFEQDSFLLFYGVNHHIILVKSLRFPVGLLAMISSSVFHLSVLSAQEMFAAKLH